MFNDFNRFKPMFNVFNRFKPMFNVFNRFYRHLSFWGGSENFHIYNFLTNDGIIKGFLTSLPNQPTKFFKDLEFFLHCSIVRQTQSLKAKSRTST